MAFAATTSKRGAFADMNKAAIDVAQTLARLSELTIFELRGEWRRLHRAPPPMRLSRDLLLRGITYKLQERPLGGLSKSIIRKLERLNLDSEASDAQKPAPPISLKAGTRLVREWRAYREGSKEYTPRARRLNGPEPRAAQTSRPRLNRIGLFKRKDPIAHWPECARISTPPWRQRSGRFWPSRQDV